MQNTQSLHIGSYLEKLRGMEGNEMEDEKPEDEKDLNEEEEVPMPSPDSGEEENLAEEEK